MNPTLLLAVTAKTHTSVMDALPHLAGMLMVMVSLTILWWVCALTARIIMAVTPKTVEATPEPRTAPSHSAEPDELAPEIVAVIAAAVATTVGRKCRIISIKPHSTSWERAGRQSVLSSHRIR